MTAQNAAGRTNSSTFTLTADSTAPGSGAITANGGGAYDTDGTVALAKIDYTDGGSGLASQAITRATATLVNDACGSFAGTDPVTILAGNDADTLTTGCYRYTLTATDNVGNQSSVQSTIVKVDTSAPTAPTLTLSNATGSVYYPGAGSTIWFRSAAGAAGSFDVTASSTDGQTGVAFYSFPALGAGWTQTGTGATRTYTYADAAAVPGASNVTATNGAGTGSGNGTFTVSSDTTNPTGGSITANGGGAYDGDGTVALAQVDLADAGSGIGAHTLTRESATLAADACGGFAGSDPVTILAGNDRTRSPPAATATHSPARTTLATSRVSRARSSRSTPPRRAPRLCSFPISPRTRTTPRARCTSAHRQVERSASRRRRPIRTRASRRTRRLAQYERRHQLQRHPDRRPLRLHVRRDDDRAEHRAHRHRYQRRRRRLGQRLVPDRRRRAAPQRHLPIPVQTCAARSASARRRPTRTSVSSASRSSVRPPAPARGRQSPPTRPRATASRRASTRRPWPMGSMTCVHSQPTTSATRAWTWSRIAGSTTRTRPARSPPPPAAPM